LAGLKLTKTAIEFGFTKISFNEDFLVLLTHMFATLIHNEHYYNKDLAIAKIFKDILNDSKLNKLVNLIYHQALTIMEKLALLSTNQIVIQFM